MLEQISARADLLLVPVAAALYAFDLARLLYVNELLFVRRQGGRWYAHLPDTQLEISRRFPAFVRPFDPGVSIARMTWPKPEETLGRSLDTNQDSLAELIRQLRVTRIGCTALLPQIFLGLPLLYFLGGSYLALAACLGAIYLQILGLVAWMLAKRRRLGLAWPTCALFAFESLICIPYAINLNRKLTERLIPDKLTNDVVSAGSLLLADDALTGFKHQLRERAQTLVDQSGTEDRSSRRLGDFLERLDEGSAQ